MDTMLYNSSNETSNGTSVFDLPLYSSYLILIFRVVATLFITITNMLAFSVVSKIRTQPLVNNYKIFTINLLVSGMLTALLYTIQTGGMIISYIVDVEDPFRCDVLTFTLSTLEVTAFNYLLISADKAVTIIYGARYFVTVTNKLRYLAIAIVWIIAFAIGIIKLFDGESYIKTSQYGACIPTSNSFISVLLTFTLPLSLAFLTAFALDVYLIRKAFHLQKQQIYEIQCCGTSDEPCNTGLLERLRNARQTVAQHFKQIKGLIIAILTTSWLGILLPILYITVEEPRHDPTIYDFLVEDLFIPNIIYIYLIINSLVCSLCYKHIRQPLFTMVKKWSRCGQLRDNIVSPSTSI
ncbi:glucose-dependent insulinotropic receptor-like [Dysidea avara]|uniref:glucose-dependent insulinotropic receptor-like n=1 Tax=Dysidea avara TaxID=196820 RepID=UPI003330EBC3